MVKIHSNSVIEIWGSTYINSPEKREVKDRDAVIVQIEPTPASRGDNYMVEVLRSSKEEGESHGESGTKESGKGKN